MADVQKLLIKDYYFRGTDYPAGYRKVPEELAKLIDNDMAANPLEVTPLNTDVVTVIDTETAQEMTEELSPESVPKSTIKSTTLKATREARQQDS